MGILRDLDERLLADVDLGPAEATREHERLEAFLHAPDSESIGARKLKGTDDGPLERDADLAKWEEAR